VKAFCLSLFSLLFSYFFASGQKMYVSLGNGSGIKKVNITATGCISDTVFVCPDQNFFAIALYGDKLYYASNSLLYAGTIINDTVTSCNPVDFTPNGMSSMTVDVNGIIYSASQNSLFRWDPNSGIGFEFLGNMPFNSAGDMVFYEGELYMASTTGIVKVNISNPSASTMHIPMNSVAVYGMAVISVDCNLNKVYALETVDAGDATNVIELDLVNRTVVGVTCQVPYGVADAASEVEGGTFAGISLREIKIIPQCKVPGKGMIHVIREPGQAVYTYLLNGTVSNTTGIFENLDPGSYRIEISTPGGCYLDTTVDVPLFDPVIPAVQEHHINPDCINGGRVWFTISPDDGKNKVIYNGDTLSAAFQFVDLNEGLHHFSIVDQYYCELDAKDITLMLEGSCDTVYFPTAFTPNNDGRNDLFRGLGNRSVRDYKLTIYNRWGQPVFTTTNVISGWNGKLGEIEQATGLYIWLATYRTPAGVLKKAKGTVMLLR
jgi:gliding motility-associated-like protein